MSQNIITPVGRLVQGHPMEGQTTDSKGQPKLVKTGPNAGQPQTTYFGAIAFPKYVNGQPNQEWAALFATLDAEARTGYPQYFNGQPDPTTGKPACTHPRFTYKIADGDGIDADGKPNNRKEGFAGHWVLKFSSNFAPRCFHVGRYDPMQQIQNKNEIKTGDYIRIAGNVSANIGSDVPGLYVNWNLVELIAAGAAIVSGPNAAEVFGGAPAAQLPQGALTVAPGSPPPVPGAAAHQPATGFAAPSARVEASAPPLPGQPNHAFVQNAAGAPPMPPVPAAPPLPPAAHVPVVTLTPAAASQGFTLQSFYANGWTDDQIISNGYATRQ